ncbi:MAG: hypothetical protein Ta2B_20250 [Termitinemataceae bacterium]|nr:MAG: hypothetical protein Ta2B_20250 [Termitinemataceae bacterium]
MNKTINALFFFLFAISCIFTYEETDSGEVQDVGRTILERRRLSWERVVGADRYRVQLEVYALPKTDLNVQSDPKSWGLLSEYTMRENFIDLSLEAGSYRYRVLMMDIFGVNGYSSEWVYFEIKSKPVINIVNVEDVETVEDVEAVENVESVETVETVINEHTVYRPSAQNFFFTLAYSPLISLTKEFGIYFDSSFYPGGLAASFAYLIPHAFSFGKFGVEAVVSYNYLDCDHWTPLDGDWRAEGNLFGGSLNVLLFCPFKSGRLALVFRAGAGISFIYNIRVQTEYKVAYDVLSGWMLALNAAPAIQYNINDVFFVEAKLEFRAIFSDDNNLPIFIAPALSLGWRF